MFVQLDTMKVVVLVICLSGLIIGSDATTADSSFKWSKSYSLKAVLTIPSANVNETYQVWVDGDTGRSRVDFYDGLDKLYRQWNEIDKHYEYFKVHPDTKTDRAVCHKISFTALEAKMYALNAYLPDKPWNYVRTDKINNVIANKYVFEHSMKVDKDTIAKAVYFVWVTFNKSKETVPVRFVYELKYENRILVNFHHDYLYFDDKKPNIQTLLMPLGIKCNAIDDKFQKDPKNYPLEYLDSILNNSRAQKVFYRIINDMAKNKDSNNLKQAWSSNYLRRMKLRKWYPLRRYRGSKYI